MVFHKISPFHRVKAGLRAVRKAALENNDIEDFKQIRATILMYLERQYQRISDAAINMDPQLLDPQLLDPQLLDPQLVDSQLKSLGAAPNNALSPKSGIKLVDIDQARLDNTIC